MHPANLPANLIVSTCFLVAIYASSAMADCAGLTPAGGAGDCRNVSVVVPDGKGKTFRVGPGQAHASLGEIPWSTLTGGDTVYIHHRPTPYREKILISGRGTAEQWIRVLGVPGPNGERPVISGDGATTSKTMRYRWTDPKVVQSLGVVQLAVNGDHDSVGGKFAPAYVEIANLQIQDGFSTYRFTAENGETLAYSTFAACIYARSVHNIVVRNNILTNCGQGFYTWTGDGAPTGWWAALQTNTVVSGNYFYNNGNPGSFTEHQVYTESDRVTIEYNRFGPQRVGAKGSQIKDRSAGTVIRYNTIEQAYSGWDIDLVEPEESWPSLSKKAEYKQTFVYGNLITSRGAPSPNFIHWNEDHQAGHGRATLSGAKLFFYHNTILIHSARSDSQPYTIFNGTWGGYDCPPGDLPGVIDVRNNIIAVLPMTRGAKVPPIRLGYCGKERIDLGVNWISPGFYHKGPVGGVERVISPADNDPGFRGSDDLRLGPNSAANGIGGVLAPETQSNALQASLTPAQRFSSPGKLERRATIGKGSDLGAF